MTGRFTGRSPKDRFIVHDDITRETVDWNAINQPIEPKYFKGLKQKMIAYLNAKKSLLVMLLRLQTKTIVLLYG